MVDYKLKMPTKLLDDLEKYGKTMNYSVEEMIFIAVRRFIKMQHKNIKNSPICNPENYSPLHERPYDIIYERRRHQN